MNDTLTGAIAFGVVVGVCVGLYAASWLLGIAAGVALVALAS